MFQIMAENYVLSVGEGQLVLCNVQARLVALRELQSATGEELSALLPSVLDRAFKGE